VGIIFYTISNPPIHADENCFDAAAFHVKAFKKDRVLKGCNKED
jgi:hypothetical protein